MGLDVNGTRFLLAAKEAGVDFSSFAMIGRQKMHLTSQNLKFLLDGFGYKLSVSEVDQLLIEDQRFSEPFIKILGGGDIYSFDASKYENATYIHDMNLPIADKFKEKYTAVLDGGSLEHVFNFPVAIKNCMEMVKTGGYYLGITPVNNFMGHGFYQFSPELYYRVFTEKNGFKVENMVVFEDVPGAQWTNVPDPEVLQKRVELVNQKPTYLLVLAKKISTTDIFKDIPQQSYNQDFYESQVEGSSLSAEIILPLVLELIKPTSVIDVGCGVGTWLHVYKSLGVEKVLGLDGDYVDRDVLKVDSCEFKPTDLVNDFNVNDKFDLVQSLEVAEHLDKEYAEHFVSELVGLGPVVLFSAAVPFQLGTHHVNEQFLPYWKEIFESHGYLLIDIIRPKVWNNNQVEVCYRQNIVLFVKDDYLSLRPELQKALSLSNVDMCSVIHPELLKPRVGRLLKYTFEAAKLLHQTGQLQHAEKFYLSILDFDPHMAEVWDAHGQLAAQGGNLPVALKSFANAVDKAADNATFVFNYGQALLLSGDKAQAKIKFQQALKIKPDYVSAKSAIEKLNS